MEAKLLQEKLATFGLSNNVAVSDKSKEIFRKLLVKLPVGMLGRAESCRATISVDIACKLTNTPVQRNLVLKNISIGETEYSRILNTCRVALGVSWSTPNVEQVLSVQFNPELVEQIKPILDIFNNDYVRKLPVESRIYVKIDSALYKCAAFCVAAGHKHLKVDKSSIATLAETNIAQLAKVTESVREIWKKHKEDGKADHGERIDNAAGEQQSSRVSSEQDAAGQASGRGDASSKSVTSSRSSILQQLRIQNRANVLITLHQQRAEAESVANDAKQSAGVGSGEGVGMGGDSGSSLLSMKRTASRNDFPESVGQHIASKALSFPCGPSTSTSTSTSTADASAVSGSGAAGSDASNGAGVNLSVHGEGDSSAAGRAAYEVWREAMRERKRAKLNR